MVSSERSVRTFHLPISGAPHAKSEQTPAASSVHHSLLRESPFTRHIYIYTYIWSTRPFLPAGIIFVCATRRRVHEDSLTIGRFWWTSTIQCRRASVCFSSNGLPDGSHKRPWPKRYDGCEFCVAAASTPTLVFVYRLPDLHLHGLPYASGVTTDSVRLSQ